MAPMKLLGKLPFLALAVPVLAGLLALGVSAQPSRESGRPGAQPTPQPAPSKDPGAPPAAPVTALVSQLLALFPMVQGEVLEVRDRTITLNIGRKDGVQPGLEVEVYREGREIKHPRTGQVLGKTEVSLGRVSVTQVQEAFSLGTVVQGGDVKPSDLFRVSAGKVKIVLLQLLGGVREGLVEQASQALVEQLNATGRFQVTMGDSINVYLAEKGIKAEEFLDGKGVQEAGERFKVAHILAVHFTRVQNRAFMDTRFFSLPRPDPAVASAFFIPPSIRQASQQAQFSGSGRDGNRPQAKPRSLLARLLGGDLDPATYSSGESALPLREVARFPFPVLAMDIAVTPGDKIPRLVAGDGERVYMYRIAGQKLEPEWSMSVRSMGRLISVYLVDLDGDGTLEVVGSRHHAERGLNSFVLVVKDGKPRYAADNVDAFLFPVDAKGAGVKQTLWTQRFSPENFFTPGQAELAVLKNGKLEMERAIKVPAFFRPTGATLANITGKETRGLALIDEFNRLQLTLEGEDLWRSTTAVGGGYMTVEVALRDVRGGRSKFFKLEPTPLAVDLDGDGVDEIIVPQNIVKPGLIAVIFKGPAGYRLQSLDSGFEGGITAMGAYRNEEDLQPTVVMAAVRFANSIGGILKAAGDTQIIMTIPQE